jgi:phosphoribosyl 1,2-cyclic phosphodiesterase
MNITLWGTRGSLAAPGPATARYGGNTSCVQLVGKDGSFIVLDAGTGIRPLSEAVDSSVRRVDILLTHLHMDHVQGLGFFGPLYDPEMEVHIWGPPSTTLDLRERLSRYLSPPLFPVQMRDLPCRLTLHNVPMEGFEIGELRVRAELVSHPGPTLGYRISENSRSIAYLPDHEPALGARRFPEKPEWTSGYELASRADLLIHDAQYTTEEYASRVGWGHSAITHTLAFAEITGARRLVTFHHDPQHDDAMIDGLIDAIRAEGGHHFEVIGGTEGASFDVA